MVIFLDNILSYSNVFLVSGTIFLNLALAVRSLWFRYNFFMHSTHYSHCLSKESLINRKNRIGLTIPSKAALKHSEKSHVIVSDKTGIPKK